VGSLERLEELGSLERWGIVAPAGAGARGTREFSGGLRPVGRAMTPPFLRHEALRLGRLLTLVGASRLRGRRVAPARSARCACAVGALRLRGRSMRSALHNPLSCATRRYGWGPNWHSSAGFVQALRCACGHVAPAGV